MGSRKPTGTTPAPREALLVPRGQAPAGTEAAPTQPNARNVAQMHEVWMQLRGDWSWLVVVSGERGFSTVEFAQGLCHAGAKFSLEPIAFVEATDVSLDTAAQLVHQLGRIGSGGSASAFARQAFSSSSWAPPVTRAIVALDNPVANPLALPIALAADGAVLCVRRGRSKVAEVRETIERIGPERIVACILLD